MSSTLLLAGDVGGSKTTLAVLRADGPAPQRECEHTYASTAHAAFDELLDDFLTRAGRPALGAACIGVAGPVIGDAAEVTNLPWRIECAKLAEQTGARAVKLLNDVEATAFGMLFLAPDDFAVLNPGTPPERRGNITVIAMGTGLGEALLYWDGVRYHPIATEGGHGDYAPRTEREIDLLRHLQAQLGGHVSTERVVSGSAIPHVYRFLRARGAAAEPDWLADRIAAGDASAAVVEAGLAQRDPVCVETLELLVENLGSEAGSTALRHLALGGVLLGGGVPPRILAALQDGRFLEAFRAKGRFAPLLRGLRVAVSLVPDTALRGAAHYALRLLQQPS
ncbi:MAG TPA: glucokinase [Myxococcota bacterium]